MSEDSAKHNWVLVKRRILFFGENINWCSKCGCLCIETLAERFYYKPGDWEFDSTVDHTCAEPKCDSHI